MTATSSGVALALRVPVFLNMQSALRCRRRLILQLSSEASGLQSDVTRRSVERRRPTIIRLLQASPARAWAVLINALPEGQALVRTSAKADVAAQR